MKIPAPGADRSSAGSSQVVGRHTRTRDLGAFTWCWGIRVTGGSFSKGAERVGSPGHAGLSYAFDSFQITDRTGRTFTKASYNQAPKNRTAFALFHDPVYLTSHGTLQPTAQTTRDLSAWKGTTWPSGVPTVLDQGQTGVLQEADFFKFRGRGFIQTTWRPAYEAIIAVIKAYGGTQAVAVDYKARWISMTTGDAATTSSNADWDHLFQDSDMVIPMVAIRTHNQAGGNYLTLSDQPAGMKGTGPGSFANVGTRISGDGAYGATLRSRVLELLGALERSSSIPRVQPGGGTTNL